MTTESISTWNLLQELGFTADQTVLSDDGPGLSFDFGNLKVSASRVIGRSFSPIVLLTGVMVKPRSLAEISHEMPREIQSQDQGVAIIVHWLDSAAGGTFEPIKAPAWLDEGRQLRHRLPWEIDLVAYGTRPHCSVRRPLLREAINKLADRITVVGDEAPVTFEFDGDVLNIRCAGNEVAQLQASGPPWPHAYSISASSLKHLPKRLMKDPIEIAVWDSALTIGNRRFKGAQAAPIA